MPNEERRKPNPDPLRAELSMNSSSLIFFAAALVLLIGCRRTSEPAIDASHIPASLMRSDTIIVADRLGMAQTFTVMKTGKLSRVEVPVRWSEHFQPNAPLRLDIRWLDDSAPTEPDAGVNILASADVSPPQIPTRISSEVPWVAFDLAPVSVTAGERLAIVLTSPSDQEYHWAGDLDWPESLQPAGAYAGGQAFSRGSSAARAPDDPTPRNQWGNYFAKNDSSSGGGPDVDMGFRVFVTPSASRWPLLSLAAILLIACLAFWRRRRTARDS
jgi:hypothetical protein